ncbi:MAG: arsenate reductase (glutaredoxin) [Burkholderiales bacterium RIFCSPLOWO2_02_FULL_57_36]|nr:MAG: arsenate reductase (glutaredoxin) [Burkholderiales bacterium RIFCSPLOWO2_02_FULL_57_36]
MDTTIYHNPKCSNSRSTLAMIRNAGIEPQVIEYLVNPPDREKLKELISMSGLTVRAALRDKDALYHELGLDNPQLSDDELLDAVTAHPALLNRPFVQTTKGVRLCRPVERVLEILPS